MILGCFSGCGVWYFLVGFGGFSGYFGVFWGLSYVIGGFGVFSGDFCDNLGGV